MFCPSPYVHILRINFCGCDCCPSGTNILAFSPETKTRSQTLPLRMNLLLLMEPTGSMKKLVSLQNPLLLSQTP